MGLGLEHTHLTCSDFIQVSRLFEFVQQLPGALLSAFELLQKFKLLATSLDK